MSEYTIAEELTLPSKGLVYKQKVNPLVRLKSMTTQHEMQRLSRSDRPYKPMCEIIDDCFVENPGISSYDMCLADYQYLLLKLRVATYGPRYEFQTTCPYCMTAMADSMNIDDMKVTYCNLQDISSLLEFELPSTKKNIKIRMQTPRMIDDVTIQNKELQKKSKGRALDSALLFNICSMIETIEGKDINPIDKEDFVRNLPMMDTNYIVKKADKLSESFGVDSHIERTCSACGLDYTSSFRVSSEFFGPSID